MTMKFNINHDVRVKLSYSGREALRRQHEELKRTFPKLPDFKEKATDDEGYTKFQMWDLMSTLGSLCTLGKPSPFDTEILIDTPTDHNRENDMTERTITMQKLRAILTREDRINTPIFTDIMTAAFPIPFTPKEGEAIWTSIFGNEYSLRVFIRMDSGKYVCFDNSDESYNYSYAYAKPQTPTQKGE
jgi:hypothetical protein